MIRDHLKFPDPSNIPDSPRYKVFLKVQIPKPLILLKVTMYPHGPRSSWDQHPPIFKISHGPRYPN